MQALKTLVWIIVTVVLVSFVAMNWTTAPVNFWPLEDSYLHFEWPVGLTALLFFLLGLVPMWLIARANTWRLKRRIQSLENSLRVAAATPPMTQETPTVTHEPVAEERPVHVAEGDVASTSGGTTIETRDPTERRDVP